jgi:pyridoxine 4-dehydrogenase
VCVAAIEALRTAVELGVSHIDTADAYRPYLTNEIIYKTAKRADDAVLAATADQYIAYVPHFPLGGFPPLQSEMLELVAKRLDATPMAVAQSWLLQHSPNIMLIPGTSSVAHLRENIAGAALTLPPDVATELDAIAAAEATAKVS